MTVGQVVDRARRYARINSSAASDGVVVSMVQDAVRQFSKDVYGFPIEEYLLVEGTFDTSTAFAFNITITGGANALAAKDVVITSTARTDASGDTIASDLQTALNAAIATGDLTVTWTNFYFTIDTTTSSASTAITIDSPDSEDFIDAQYLLGLAGSVDVSAGVFTGDFPEDCTRKATLAGTPISVKHVAWDRNVLSRAPREVFVRPNTTGDPVYYYVEGNDILLTPSPSSQKELYVMYKGIPDLSDITNYASGTLPTAIPEDYHIALAYWVSAELLLESFEDDMRKSRLASYYDKVNQYKVNYYNQNTSLEPKATRGLWYRVEE